MASLNIAYFFSALYGAALGTHVNLAGVPTAVWLALDDTAIVGLALAFIFLVLIMYSRIRIIQIGEELAHKHAHASAQHREEEPKNARWEMVAGLMASPSESDWRRAILEADILLAALLTERGLVGDSVGEQLKMANPLQFTTLDLAWEAHRMRNALAHLGEGFPLTERDARATIELYRRVFEEFDYI